jgi:membrane associated rhomboid family serine protease
MIPIRDTLQSRHFPVVTVSLIVINLLVFLYQGYLQTQPASLNDGAPWQAENLLPPPGFNSETYATYLSSHGDLTGPQRLMYPIAADDLLVAKYGLIPGELLGGRDLPPTIAIPLWLTLLTSMFLHGSILHVVGNMLYLWVFGDNVEDAMGPVRFLLFYILCGAAAGLAQVGAGPASPVPTIGASGAIAGVLAAYLVLYPRARILTLIPIFFFVRLIAIPAALLLGFWFFLQIFSGVGALGSSTGVAWFAHIGGFVAGLLLVIPLRRPGVPLGLLRLLRARRPSP